MSIVPNNPKLQEALSLAQLGYHVFPLHGTTSGRCDCARPDCSTKEAGKHPSQVSSWTAQATTNPKIIQHWWDHEPNSNIAIQTGVVSNLLVVDCDISNSGNGFTQLQLIDPKERTIDEWETARARTGSGGFHLYFACPEESLTIGSKIDGKNIDLRCNGGYVAAPPSVNGSGAYTWIQHPSDGDLMECPGWLIEFLKKGGGRKKKASLPSPSSSGLTFEVEDELNLETHPGAEAGNRNGLLCKLVGAALGSGIAPDEVMRQALAWNRRCRPAKGEAGIRKSVQALISSEFQKLRGKASGSQQQAQPTLKGLPASSPAQMVLVTRQASTIKPQVLRWLWPNHLQLGAVNLVAGPEGRGKSLIAVDIAARTTTGSAWPDGSPCEQGRVLYCSAEENIEAVVIPRLMAAGADLSRVEIVDGLGSSSDEGKVIADIDLKKCLPAVHKKLKDIGDGEPFRLCIWDTFQSVCLTADHKSNVEQKAIVQPLQAIADELAVGMMCIEHHNRGGLGRGNPDAAILGGGLTRTARVIWHVVEDPESPELIRLFIPGKMNNTSKAEDLGWRFTFADVERCIDGKQVMLPRIEWIEPAGVTLHEVQARVNGEAGAGGDAKGQFSAAVEWLRENLTEPTLAAVMEEGFKTEGFSKTTMKRAKDHLCIKSKRNPEGPGWLWMPSPQVSIGGEVIADPMAK